MSEHESHNRLSVTAQKIREGIIIPAKQEADSIVAKASLEAKRIIENADKTAASILKKANNELDTIKSEISISSALTIREFVSKIRKYIVRYFSDKSLLQEVGSLINDKIVAKKIVDAFCDTVNKSFFEEVNLSVSSNNENLSKYIADLVSQKMKIENFGIKVGDDFKISIDSSSAKVSIDNQIIVKVLMEKIGHKVVERIFGSNSIEDIVASLDKK